MSIQTPTPLCWVLKKVLKLFYESSIFPERDDIEYFKTLISYAYSKGWLYVVDKDNDIVAAGIGYFVKEGYTNDVLPEKEEGDQFYILAVASKDNDKAALKQFLRKVMKIKNTKKVIWDRIKENDNGKEQRSRFTSNT